MKLLYDQWSTIIKALEIAIKNAETEKEKADFQSVLDYIMSSKIN